MQGRAHPVNLVIGVWEHVNRTDNTSTRRSLHFNRYLAIEDVVVGHNCRGISLFVHREFCTIRPSDYCSTKCRPFIQSRSLRQVVVDMAFGVTFVRRAGFLEGIAVRCLLSKNESEYSSQGCKHDPILHGWNGSVGVWNGRVSSIWETRRGVTNWRAIGKQNRRMRVRERKRKEQDRRPSDQKD